MWLSNGTNNNDWGHWMSFSHWQDFETAQCIAFAAPEPLVCIASVAVDSKPFSTNISSVCQTGSFHWLMSVSGVFIHSQPSATFFSCAASLLIDSSRYDCYHGRMGAVGLHVSDCANDSPHKNYILESKIMFVVAVSKLDWIVSISIVRMWLEIRS